jgi:GDP-L-fucose synthase
VGINKQLSRRVLIVGDKGFLGSAVTESLGDEFEVLRFSDYHLRLTPPNRLDFKKIFEQTEPDVILCLAGRRLNFGSTPQEIVCNYEYNSKVQNDIIDAAYEFGNAKFLFPASSVVYDFLDSQTESFSLITTQNISKLPKNYLRVKLEGLERCFRFSAKNLFFSSVIISNVYGPGEYSSNQKSFVSQAIFDIFNASKSGSESVTFKGHFATERDFIYVEDFANAIKRIIADDNFSPIYNIGSGKMETVQRVSDLVARYFGYEGSILFSQDVPEISSRRLMDISLIHKLGWENKTTIEVGLRETIKKLGNTLY